MNQHSTLATMATHCTMCMHARPQLHTSRTANPLRSAAAAVSQRSAARQPRVSRVATRAGLDLDWSDPDTLIGLAGAVLGITVGIGAPLFYISRDEADEKRLEELRELNRQTYKETGEYMTEVGSHPPPPLGLCCCCCFLGRHCCVDDTSEGVREHGEHPAAQEEIAAFRRPRWTDRRCALCSPQMS